MIFIAEIGWNFMGDMALASKMIADAKNAGATAAKFQYWNPSKLKSGPWDLDGRRAIYEKAFLTEEKINILIKVCEQNDIEFLTSVFNVEDAELIRSFGIESIKVPSHASHDTELHKFVSHEFTKAFVSLGACSEEELFAAIQIYQKGRAEWVGMHCVSSYPCPPDKVNFPRMVELKSRVPVLGYSDHTTDLVTPAIAAALGAEVIEKHFTSDKSLPGRDNQFAVVKEEFLLMVENCHHAKNLMINHGMGAMDCEIDTMKNYRGRWG